MTEEKRQRVLVGVLAVCVLGAGGVWVALHDWSGSAGETTRVKSAERKKREITKKAVTKRAKRRDRSVVEKAARQDRDTARPDDHRRKQRKNKRGDKKTKKKKIVPVS